MGGEWRTRKIGSLGRVVTGKTPSTADRENFGSDYPFITIPDLDGRVLIHQTARSLSEKGANAVRTSLLPAGAVMMSCIATVGKCGITTRPSFTNQQINSVIPRDDVDSRYLYYVFTQLGQELESAGGGGSVYTNVSKSRFSDIEIVIPSDLPEQRAIAHVLGTLDDKIELNRKVNEALESMARAIFKSWFIDFDPVRTKMEGRWKRGQSLPGLPAHLYDLFPDRLVPSELGEIPEAWNLKKLEDISMVIDCLHSKKPLEQPIGKLLIQVFNVGNNGRLDFSTPYYISSNDYEIWIKRMEVDPGDVVITKTGRVGAVGQMPKGYKAAMGRNMVGLRAIPNVTTQYFLKDYLLSDSVKLEINKNTNDGTILQSLHVKAINKFLAVHPPYSVIQAYSTLIQPIHERLECNDEESHLLKALRDTLLPKLITGELRV